MQTLLQLKTQPRLRAQVFKNKLLLQIFVNMQETNRCYDILKIGPQFVLSTKIFPSIYPEHVMGNNKPWSFVTDLCKCIGNIQMLLDFKTQNRLSPGFVLSNTIICSSSPLIISMAQSFNNKPDSLLQIFVNVQETYRCYQILKLGPGFVLSNTISPSPDHLQG